MKYLGPVFFLLVSLLPFRAALALTYDLGLRSSDIFFSKPTSALIEGQPVRIYSRISNYGSKDVTAHVVFYHGASEIIGQTLPVSVRAGGELDEVFVDWVVPREPFVVRAEVVAADPGDEQVSNNLAQTASITPLKDTDGDGLPDNVDTDDDGDGVVDTADYAPLNPAVTKAPAPPKPLTEAIMPAAEATLPIGNTANAAFPDISNAVTPVALAEMAGDVEQMAATLPIGETDPDQGVVVNGNYISSVAITSKQTGWATYDFSFLTNVPNLDVSVLPIRWEYGDGTTSSKNQLHRFPGPGTYYVRLQVAGAFGNSVTDVAVVRVSFWSFQNYVFLLSLGLLVFIAVLLMWVLVARKKKNPEK